MSNHLDELENQSVYILREAFANFKNLAMLWSIGKDSTVMLYKKSIEKIEKYLDEKWK